MQVCCSDFVLNGLSTEKAGINTITERISTEDNIETHHNIGLLSGECGGLEGNTIAGGMAATLYEFPWLALIAYNVNNQIQFNCGGTVINSKYVLTAAHCIKKKQIVGVRIGEYDISSKIDCTGEGEILDCESRYQDIGVSQTIYHREYYEHFSQLLNDIGLLRLVKPVDFSYRNAEMICLPLNKKLQDLNLTNKRGIVAGWGLTENQLFSNILLKVEVPIQSAAECLSLDTQETKLDGSYKQSVFCAGAPGQDSCKGDSGGPLMVETKIGESYKMVQFGVVSYGPAQCGSEYPGVYTDVRKYMKWILDAIKP